MRYKHAAILFAAAFLLQATVFSAAGLKGAAPDLILILTVIITFLYDNRLSGLVTGTVFALLADICFGQYAGIGALCCFVTGLLVWIFKDFFDKENFANALMISAAATIVNNVLFWAISSMAGSVYKFGYMLSFQPRALLVNLIAAAILYFILIRFAVKYRGDRQFA